VPTFYFQQQYMVPGAQEAEAFVRLLQKIQLSYSNNPEYLT